HTHTHTHTHIYHTVSYTHPQTHLRLCDIHTHTQTHLIHTQTHTHTHTHTHIPQRGMHPTLAPDPHQTEHITLRCMRNTSANKHRDVTSNHAHTHTHTHTHPHPPTHTHTYPLLVCPHVHAVINIFLIHTNCINKLT